MNSTNLRSVDLESLELATKNKLENLKFLQKMKSTKQLDAVFQKAHDAEFKKTECLNCGNCCKTTSPIFRDTDIKRIAKHLRVKEAAFIAQYLRIDEDRDYVLQSSPCAFLELDNTCSIYEYRPLACREYPHTNRKNMYQILELTATNTMICPAVARIVEQLKIK